MFYNLERSIELLRLGTGQPNTTFRDDQEDSIRHIVEGRGRLLLVQKTGWGKSFVYFIATKLMREVGAGPALLISPLLSLMRNQITAANRMGVRAATINSDNEEEWLDVESRIRRNEIDIILISPERLANDRFRAQVLASVAQRIAFLIIDEAHCISDWGHDFRPHYRLLERTVRTLPSNLRLLATTATANDRVMDDLSIALGPNLNVRRGDLDRPSLSLQTIQLPSQAERMAWLAVNVPNLSGSGIIYALTVRDAELVAAWLRSRGLRVEAYTGDTGERRPELENALLENRVKALVATSALGMGFDKPDLGFVIHYQAPGSVVAYYQQVGRAGRALDVAYGVLLSGAEETEITDYFIESAFPTREEVQQVLDALRVARDGLSKPELMGHLNLSYGRVDKAIELLSLESPAPVVKQGTKWHLTTANLTERFWQRAERLTELRRFEQGQMQEYVRLTSGHMQFLIRALDGDSSRVGAPALPPLATTPDRALVLEAVAFVRGNSLPILPRKMWPVGGMARYQVKGKISAGHCAQPGRALSCWGDAGWGDLVRRAKLDGHFTDDLVEACVALVRDWRPDPAPTWVTCIPSRRHPHLVPDFARRLAVSLSLPFQTVLERTDERPAQKTMANSVQQARNLDGAFTLGVKRLPAGPVLLVDDMVDSGWTLTVAAWLLRTSGSDLVFPLTLARLGKGQ